MRYAREARVDWVLSLEVSQGLAQEARVARVFCVSCQVVIEDDLRDEVVVTLRRTRNAGEVR